VEALQWGGTSYLPHSGCQIGRKEIVRGRRKQVQSGRVAFTGRKLQGFFEPSFWDDLETLNGGLISIFNMGVDAIRPVYNLERKYRVTMLTREDWTKVIRTPPVVKGLNL
jgi:hypothetical protein